MSRDGRIKKTKKLIKKLQPYWKRLGKAEQRFSANVRKIEKDMEKKTGIKGIEFIMCDNEYCGIGDATREMELIHNRELDEGRVINYE